MQAEVFLFGIALIWIIFASIQDLRKREVANWLNFSLVVFALGFRFFYSLFSEAGFGFFYQGLSGLLIFFVLGNLLYYGKLFAGGDAKLFIALGAVLPFSASFFVNLRGFILFLIVFFIAAAIYSLIFSFILGLRNFKKVKKELKKVWKKNKRQTYILMIFGLIFMIFGFYELLFFILGILIFIAPYFYIYAKAIDEACMVKRVPASALTQGDWLYKNVEIGKREIKTSWEGVKKKDIALLKKHKKVVVIRQGIPFTPVFFFAFLIFIYLVKSELGDFLF